MESDKAWGGQIPSPSLSFVFQHLTSRFQMLSSPQGLVGSGLLAPAVAA